MKIKVQRNLCADGSISWEAFDSEASGSPKCGRGRNYLEAIADLVINDQIALGLSFNIVDEHGNQWKHLCGKQYTRRKR